MSKAEILRELPKLGLQERREIFERIGELEDQDLVKGGEPSAADKELLDRELEEYRQNPEAGSTWPEVESRLRKSTRS
jgi:putative addiction module component (TIGR02574 family)